MIHLILSFTPLEQGAETHPAPEVLKILDDELEALGWYRHFEKKHPLKIVKLIKMPISELVRSAL